MLVLGKGLNPKKVTEYLTCNQASNRKIVRLSNFNFFWKQRQRPSWGFWIRRHREKERERESERDLYRKIEWSPLPLLNDVGGNECNKSSQGGRNSHQSFENLKTFFSFAKRTPTSKSNVQQNAEAQVFLKKNTRKPWKRTGAFSLSSLLCMIKGMCVREGGWGGGTIIYQSLAMTLRFI